MAKTIPVNLGERSYDVTVGAGVLADVGSIVAAAATSPRAIIVTDSNVRGLYADAVAGSLTDAGLAVSLLEFPAGEASKNAATYTDLAHRALELDPPIDRGSLVVTVGGGVAGDLGGFVAATLLRGIDFVNVPTTLLADVDASVGGKTGVDAPAGKNLIGAFHQPRAVVIDSAVLKTLPAAEMGNGLAECVKHAVLADASLLEFIEDNLEPILAADADLLADLIARNVAIKAEVVAADERESGRRAHLNLGHTLGHAVETAAEYTIGHGQAVSLGMAAALHIAAGRGLIESEAVDRVRDVLTALSLPVRFADLPDLPSGARDPDRLISIMARDKKARAGVPRFVLPTNIGNVAVFDDVTRAQIADAVNALSS